MQVWKAGNFHMDFIEQPRDNSKPTKPAEVVYFHKRCPKCNGEMVRVLNAMSDGPRSWLECVCGYVCARSYVG